MWKGIRRNYRRLVAFLLTAVMVGTNVCANVGVAFAAGMSESALFLVDGEELREAIQEAKEHREVFSFSALELAAARKSIRNRYEKLLGKKDGEVYELDLEVDDSYAPEGAAVQVFYHAGTEDVVFLFLNETDMEVEYRVNIDGYETEPVTVKPNTFNIEAEEDTSFGENYEAADMIDDVKTAPKAEVVETKETSAGEESEEAGKDEATEDASLEGKEESSAADETLADEEESQEAEADTTEAALEEGTEKTSEIEAADKEDEETDAQAEVEQAAETETEPETEAETEVEDNDEVLDEREGETLSKSNRQAAVVAVSLGDLEEESTEATEVSVEEETEVAETEKETEAEERAEGKTEEAAGSETTEAEDENKATEAEAEETEAETEEESKAEDTETEEATEAEETEAEETEKDATVEETEAEDKTTVGETKSEEETGKDSAGSDSSKTGSTDKMDGQLLEDDSIEFLGKLKGKDYATVTLKNHVNARALKVAWEDILPIIKASDKDGEDVQSLLDAINEVIANYRNGIYESDEDLEADIDTITAMIGAFDEDFEYPEELIEAMAELQKLLGLEAGTLEAEEECTCEYLCTWFWGKYIKINSDCPVCSKATEEELDPYTYDPEHPEDFICKGKQVVIPGNNEECTHNGWAPGGGSPELLPATCHSPATTEEAIECWGCGARWLWSFDENSEIDPDAHYYGRNEPEIKKEATCTEDGLMVQECKFCGEIETVIKGGHVKPENPDEITVVPATCKDGSVVYTCANCGEEVTEVLQGRHTFPEGKVPEAQYGVCTECGAIAYEVYTYEKGATPSGSGYETQLCTRMIAEKDGETYGVDRDGYRLDGDTFTVVINESLMGKVKPRKDAEGNIVMTQVVGYRSMDDDNGEIYKAGQEVAYADVPELFKADMPGAFYYSDNNRRVIYLEDVREDVVNEERVEYDFTNSNPDSGLRTTIADTSDGIEKEITFSPDITDIKVPYYDNISATITYIIPEDYAEDTVKINATDDMMDAYAIIQDKRFANGGVQGGDLLGPVYIQVINNSQKTFSYVDDSITLQSNGHYGQTPYLEDIRSFDGVGVPETSIPPRVSNGALKYLYQKETGLGNEDLTDEKLGETLKAKGYVNGIADLHQFYLDYYNHAYSEKYGTTWSNLSDVPYGLLVQRDEGIFGGHGSNSPIKETNPEVAGVGYSFMYTRLLSAVLGDEGRKDEAGDFAVANYMRGNAPYVLLDHSAKSAWGMLEPSSQARALKGLSLYFNGETNDFYQDTEWGIEVGFELVNKKGSLVIAKSVTGTAGEKSKAFPFTLTLTGKLDEDAFASMGFVKQEGSSSWTMDFELKDGETKTIADIPAGTEYRIEETGSEDYEVTVIKGTVSEKATVVSGKIQSEDAEHVEFVNHKDEEEKTGSLMVRKTVSGSGASTSKDFAFTVTLDDQTINGKYGDMVFENGVASFRLAHGQSRRADNLPAGITYEVKESDYDGYISSSENEAGTIPEGTVVIAAFNNHRPGDDNPPDTPDEPDRPDNPGRPNRPSGGGGGNSPRGGDNPGGPGTTTTIETPEVPLADFPNEPVAETIEDSEVPLAALPKTGDSRQNGALLALLGMAGLGALFSAMALRKRKED